MTLPSSDEGESRSDASAVYRQLMRARIAGGSAANTARPQFSRTERAIKGSSTRSFSVGSNSWLG